MDALDPTAEPICGAITGEIPFVAERFPDFFKGFGLFVTCLDSSEELAAVGYNLNSRIEGPGRFTILGESLWIAAEHVLDALREPGIFCAFDEVYLLRSAPVAPPRIRGNHTCRNFSEEV